MSVAFGKISSLFGVLLAVLVLLVVSFVMVVFRAVGTGVLIPRGRLEG